MTDTTTFASYTGYTERQNIMAQIASLAGGRVFQGKPNDTQLSKKDGQVEPYVIAMFGRPVPATTDRGLGGEKTQPYIMAMTFACIGPTADLAGRLAAKLTERLLDFLPNGDNASPIKGAGGFAYQHIVAANAPSRFEEQPSFETTINLSPDAS